MYYRLGSVVRRRSPRSAAVGRQPQPLGVRRPLLPVAGAGLDELVYRRHARSVGCPLRVSGPDAGARQPLPHLRRQQQRLVGRVGGETLSTSSPSCVEFSPMLPARGDAVAQGRAAVRNSRRLRLRHRPGPPSPKYSASGCSASVSVSIRESTPAVYAAASERSRRWGCRKGAVMRRRDKRRRRKNASAGNTTALGTRTPAEGQGRDSRDPHRHTESRRSGLGGEPSSPTDEDRDSKPGTRRR